MVVFLSAKTFSLIHQTDRYVRLVYFQVNVSLNLRNIFEVNEKAQYISLETSLRMYWKDERITGVPLGNEEFVNVNGKAIDQFWIPGTWPMSSSKIVNKQLSFFPQTVNKHWTFFSTCTVAFFKCKQTADDFY